MRIEKIESLKLYILTDKQLENNHNLWGYKYCIYSKGSNYTAFRTFKGLVTWLNERGLKIPAHIEDGNMYDIEGIFFEVCLFRIDPIIPDFSNLHTLKTWNQESLDEFGRKNNLTPSFIMNNGNWTRSYVYNGACGLSELGVYENVSVIYYLNPNCKQNKYNYMKFNDGVPNNPEVMSS